MSVHTYTGVRPSRRPTGLPVTLPWVLTGLAILAQISWILVSGQARTALTIAAVLVFAAASISHAWVQRGAAWAAGYVVISAGLGWAVEAVGTRTGWPFGAYDYTATLGWQVVGVPLVVPAAWAMMAYPCLLAAQRLTRSLLGTALVGGWLLASWDLFLDPQMVAEGHWVWSSPTPALPNVPGIPVTNYLGWLLTSVAMMALLGLLPRRSGADGVPTTLLAWTYAGSVLANLVFLQRPWVALWGGLAMGLVIVPWVLALWSGSTRDAGPPPTGVPRGRL